jgi:hypothetical protein
MKTPCTLLAATLALCAATGAAQEALSLRLGGKEVPVSPTLRSKLADLSRQMLGTCGPNTQQHPGNFGLSAAGVEQRWKRMLDESRLRIVFAEPFVTQSHLGGTLGVTEALVGLEHKDLFVGPNYTRHGLAFTEHMQCEYLPALELACLPDLAPYLPASYRETCAKLERDEKGRIVMPPPDIAPSCS